MSLPHQGDRIARPFAARDLVMIGVDVDTLRHQSLNLRKAPTPPTPAKPQFWMQPDQGKAVRQFVELNEWQIAAIQEGVREADRGRFMDHARLKAKWEKKLAAAMDKAR